MNKKQIPTGWSERRVRRFIVHYEQQTEEQAAAEDERAFKKSRKMVEIPAELMPIIRALIAQSKAKQKA